MEQSKASNRDDRARRPLEAEIYFSATSTALTLTIQPVAAVAQDSATLPRDFSPWGMFVSADKVVKAVLIGLAFASALTWAVWLLKTVEIALAKRRVRIGLNVFTRLGSISDGIECPANADGEVGRLLDAAMAELKLSPHSLEPNSIKERIASRLERIEANYGRRILRGTGILATIGATAPSLACSALSGAL
jgi:biopolymer transport protein ExbB